MKGVVDILLVEPVAALLGASPERLARSEPVDIAQCVGHRESPQFLSAAVACHDEIFDCIEGDAEYAPGQLVCHDIFGLGRIKEFLNMGENSIVVVQFNTGKTKSLMLKYANLSKVE